MERTDYIGKIERLAKLATATSQTPEQRDQYGTLDLPGDSLFGEGYEHITFPGTAEVVNYRLVRDGVLKVDLHIGEEDSEVFVKSRVLMTPSKFVQRVNQLRGTKELGRSLAEIDKKYSVRKSKK